MSKSKISPCLCVSVVNKAVVNRKSEIVNWFMFEQLRQRISGNNQLKREPPVIVPLTPEQVHELHFGWNSHFSAETLRAHLKQFPRFAWRVMNANEYIIGDTWRKREDVGQILETRANYNRAFLVEALAQEYRKLDFGAVVLGSDEQSNYLRFYKENGFVELERIVYYEKPNVQVNFDYSSEEVSLVPFTASLMPALLKVDHASFPWLWWNDLPELSFYTAQNDVTLYLAYLHGEPVGYFGCTLYDEWGHLDRLAVVPGMQGKHIGTFLLAFCIQELAKQGAKRVTLSTQDNNIQSQRLYEGFDFQRVRNLEYSLIGKMLGESL
jgi:ribosomal protein S18 acetylase RimI-like enzyme